VKSNFHTPCILTLSACDLSLSHLEYFILLNNMEENFTFSVQGWPASAYRRGAWIVQGSPDGYSCVCVQQKGWEGFEFIQTPLFTNSKLQKSRLINKLLGRTVLDKTQRNIGLRIPVLKSMSYNL